MPVYRDVKGDLLECKCGGGGKFYWGKLDRFKTKVVVDYIVEVWGYKFKSIRYEEYDPDKHDSWLKLGVWQ